MPTIRAELHSHSTYSDGAFDPETVALMCAEQNVELWALTDHDTCQGCAEAAAAAREYGIEFVPGIEVSAFADRSIHVLGYGVNPEAPVLRQYSERRLAARHDRMQLMIARLEELGVGVDFDHVKALAGEGAIARPHLARALVDAGHVASMQEAFDRWISNDGAAYVETPWPKVEDAIEMIEAAGGFAVLAHPGIYDRDHLIPGWIEAGLAGIEVRHPKHTPQDRVRYTTLAEQHGVLMTGSSDYHGPDHLSATFFGQVDLPEAWVDRFRARL